VVATWQVSFERIGTEQPAAVALLRLCAFLAADDIPISVPSEGAPALPRELRRAAGDEVRIDRAVGALQRYALNDRQGDSLHVHRLVQAAVWSPAPKQPIEFANGSQPPSTTWLQWLRSISTVAPGWIWWDFLELVRP